MSNFLESSTFDFVEVLGFDKRPFRNKFVFSKLWNKLDSCVNDFEALVKLLKPFRVKVEQTGNTGPVSDILISGYYTPDDNIIECYMLCEDFDSQEFNKASWFQFKFTLIQVITHELTHMRQFSNRDFEWRTTKVKFSKVKSEAKNTDREYHCSLDEIEAYANCIALELLEFDLAKDKDLDDAKTYKVSPTFCMILGVFGNRLKEPVISKTIYYTKKWIKRYENEARRNNKAAGKSSRRRPSN